MADQSLPPASPLLPVVVLGVPGEPAPSNYGSGTVEIREIVGILEEAGICCCAVGVSALKYYGAWRLRQVSG